MSGKFEWNVLYGGLKNSQTHLQRAVEHCLEDLDSSLYKVYMGQILICTLDVHQHLSVLQAILSRLVSANLLLDAAQCIFLCSSIIYLGMELSRDGVAIRTEKIKRIANFPEPSNRKEMQTFLGLVDQYRRYVPDYSQLVQPLIQLANQGEYLSDDDRHAFEALKMSFQNADPIPLQPNPMDKPVFYC